MAIKYVQILNSNKEDKKYVAMFYDENRNYVKKTHFGSKNGVTYNMHKNDDTKKNWISRHSKLKGSNWNVPDTASSLAKNLLWAETSLSLSFNIYLKKFNLQKY